MMTVSNRLYNMIGGDIPFNYNFPLTCNNVVVKYGTPQPVIYDSQSPDKFLSDTMIGFLTEADDNPLYITSETNADSLGAEGGVPYNDENGNLVKDRGVGVIDTYHNQNYLSSLILPFKEWDEYKNNFACYSHKNLNMLGSVSNLQGGDSYTYLTVSRILHNSKNDTYYILGIDQEVGRTAYIGDFFTMYNDVEDTFNPGSSILASGDQNSRLISYWFYPKDVDKVWIVLSYCSTYGMGNWEYDGGRVNRMFTQDPFRVTFKQISFNYDLFTFGMYQGNARPYPYND